MVGNPPPKKLYFHDKTIPLESVETGGRFETTEKVKFFSGLELFQCFFFQIVSTIWIYVHIIKLELHEGKK